MKLTNSNLLEIGFNELPHFTIGNSITYELGQNRILSASSVGTPNEVLFICELGGSDATQITDIICLHNYDYDGYLTMRRLTTIIELFDRTNKHKV